MLRAFALAAALVGAGLSARALEPGDLGWDLSYAAALKSFPIGSSEFMAT